MVEIEYLDHDDVLIISVRIANTRVKRITMDTGRLANVLYLDAFQKLGLIEKALTPMASTLTELMGESISPLGTTTLPITIREGPRSKTVMVTFTVVRLPSAYNIIHGYITLNKLRVVISIYHRTMKFPTQVGTRKVISDPRESRQCYLTAILLSKKPKPKLPMANPRDMAKVPPCLEPTKLGREDWVCTP